MLLNENEHPRTVTLICLKGGEHTIYKISEPILMGVLGTIERNCISYSTAEAFGIPYKCTEPSN